MISLKSITLRLYGHIESYHVSYTKNILARTSLRSASFSLQNLTTVSWSHWGKAKTSERKPAKIDKSSINRPFYRIDKVKFDSSAPWVSHSQKRQTSSKPIWYVLQKKKQLRPSRSLIVKYHRIKFHFYHFWYHFRGRY